MLSYSLGLLALLSSLLLVALPAVTLEDAPWNVPKCFKVAVTPNLEQDDCITVIRAFVDDHQLPHCLFTRTLPPRPQLDIVFCPWKRTYGTCSLMFNMREGSREHHETSWVATRALLLTQYCAGRNQIGGRMRIGDSLVVVVVQSHATGPLGISTEGENP